MVLQSSNSPAVKTVTMVSTESHAPVSASAESTYHYPYPVAVCTLGSPELLSDLTAHLAMNDTELKDMIVAGLTTENIGIEQLMSFCLTAPNLRTIVLCGTDPQQAIGHLPGQTLMALIEHGVSPVTPDMSAGPFRINRALGKRPILNNLSADAIEHFRQQIRIIDCIGCQDISHIMTQVHHAVATNPGPVEVFIETSAVEITPGYVPDTFICDPGGYCVIQVDAGTRLINLKHFQQSRQTDRPYSRANRQAHYLPTQRQRADHVNGPCRLSGT